MTTLYDDRNLSVDVDEFIIKYLNIGLKISGGVDSAFTLFWLAKRINDLGLTESHTILPIHALEKNWPWDTYQYHTKDIIDLIKDMFPKVIIFDTYIIEYIRDDPEVIALMGKGKLFIRPKVEKLKKGLVDIVIGGNTSAPIGEDINLGRITKERAVENRNDKFRGPFQLIDKKFIAYQYNKFDLMDTLFPLTYSCVIPNDDKSPCKECDFCKEKYWAFGYYDGKVK